MSKFNLTALLSGVAVVVGALSGATPAQAGELYNDWNYGIDRFNDGSGGSLYNYKGLAFTETEDNFIFALSGGLNYNEVSDTNLTHGDLFLNFSGGDFDTANGTDSLLAVKFAPNDTNLEAGLYKDVTAGDLNQFADIDHAGESYSSLDHYYDFGWGRDGGNVNKVTNTFGTDLATRQETYDYFYSDEVAANPTRNNTTLMNAIKSGTKVGDVSMLDKATLNGQYGLDFGHFNAVGSDVFGISLDKSMLEGVLPGGITEFMAHTILECGNDGVALAGAMDIPEEEQDVPEPTALLGLGSLGLLLVKGRKQQNA
ncbi:PEP-CTERM sorting domain-containing protein [Spirulina sp. CS-785/01]|uniref:XDD3 family exosortase-dependent surface protein n=1 Tax=Spirulina sp. CS-785/01 TaxID=3021716 RepID=UPI00232EF3B1|nr:XDD3 family exosortase-dependent surface protein [Spirulina sp. CS-785/01]MDB9312562.1 PEP-CTERM sorting domain-containing protein [Spirulina sp. CS-785/01]